MFINKYILNYTLIAAVSFSIIPAIKCANILALLGIPSPSHHIWNSALVYALAERGHNVTVLAPDLPQAKDIPTNVSYIHLEEVYNSMAYSEDGKLSLNDFIGVGPIEDIPLLYDWSIKGCLGVVKSKGLDVLLRYPERFKFDLVIHDFTLGPCLIGFAHKFNYPPIVGVSAFLYPPNTIDIVGGHLFPSYIPFYATSSYDTDMTFAQRMHNTLVYMLDSIYRNYYVLPKINQLIRHKYPEGTPKLEEIDRRTVVALVNSHPAINYPESLPPSIIEVGGLQLREGKQLTEEFRHFIDRSRKGAILMSFGTNMHASNVGDKLTRIILDAMTLLTDYNFIWKYEHEFEEGELPANVMVQKFLPQNDILAHPKIKAFITHCGGLSTQEATWHAVPMVGIPLFVDQPRNMHKSFVSGVGEKIDFLTMDTELLVKTIRKVAENASYKKNMVQRSKRFRDRPMKPLDTAVWWIEYVLREPQPNHLKPPTLNMSFIASNSLDFIFLLLLLICTPFVCAFVLLYSVMRAKSKLIGKKKTN